MLVFLEAPKAPASPAEGLARLLVQRRVALGITREQLATRTGSTRSLIYRIESGEETPTLGQLELIAKGLESGVEIEHAEEGPRAVPLAPA